MIEGSIHQEDIIVLYEPNIGAPKYIKQILTNKEGEIYNKIIGDFNIPL